MGPTPPGTWQPIETAPKDGTLILAWMGIRATLAEWESQSHHKKPQPYWRSEFGWLAGVAWDRANQPTHWMPLPAPPEAK